MNGLHPHQQKIMDHLLENQAGATLDELADHLGISKSAARDHIVKIETLGYLDHVDTKNLVGRPRRRYVLAKESHEIFPKQYSWLSTVLLEHLAESVGSDGVARTMRGLADKVAESMRERFDDAKSTSELLGRVRTALNELGYRSVVRQADVRKGAILEASNCVYHTVAQKHPELCAFDIRFIEKATGLDVKLETCIARGGGVCRFCLKKKS